ncbi:MULTISPECIES: hypothetical protein [unclassified Lacinutrix]
MLSDFRNKVISFLNSSKDYPILAAIASGLYPLTFYYYRNFTLINSWSQFLYFVFYFLIIPYVVFKIAYSLCIRVAFFKPIKKFVLPLLNFSWSIYLLIYVTIGFTFKTAVFAFVLVLIGTFLLYRYFNKIVVFQLLLAGVTFFWFSNYFLFNIKNPSTWISQPDSIEEVIFKKKPNIYFIQPDGYANFSEIEKGYYKFDNSVFESYLNANDFKVYANYRSNYYSTLSSNSSLFAMKHHYYNEPSNRITELYNARDVIVGENPVLQILNNNNYNTQLLIDSSYLLKNRPHVAYDYCNIDPYQFSPFPKGFQAHRDVFLDLKTRMKVSKETNNFYFIEKLSPSHITINKNPGNIAEKERVGYLERLKKTNVWLKKVVDFIIANDENSMIVIAADHGGFVGMNTTLESRAKRNDRDLIYSIFTAQLAIKWPGKPAAFDDKIKTPVNLFRVLISYLSENEMYLQNLQEDKSYLQIIKDAPIGVYEYINEKGEVVFNKHVK